MTFANEARTWCRFGAGLVIHSHVLDLMHCSEPNRTERTQPRDHIMSFYLCSYHWLIRSFCFFFHGLWRNFLFSARFFPVLVFFPNSCPLNEPTFKMPPLLHKLSQSWVVSVMVNSVALGAVIGVTDPVPKVSPLSIGPSREIRKVSTRGSQAQHHEHR